MNKGVVISSNNNSNYLFYIPIIAWAWNKLGWRVFKIFVGGDKDKIDLIERQCARTSPQGMSYKVEQDENLRYKTETLAQCSRMYISNCLNDSVFVMISDCDMLPLSDYWKPKFDEITCYGRDLSDEHYPMCYVAANVNNWAKLMGLSGDCFSDDDMRRDLKEEKEVCWTSDQNIITRKLNKVVGIVRIDRGINPYTGYPIGRVDRSAWAASLQQPERIDAHLLREGWRDENWSKTISLIKECFKVTDEEIAWMEEYRQKYIQFL